MYTRYDIYFKSDIKKKVFLATIISTLKNPQNLAIKTPPQVNKKGKQLFSQFNNHLT